MAFGERAMDVLMALLAADCSAGKGEDRPRGPTRAWQTEGARPV